MSFAPNLAPDVADKNPEPILHRTTLKELPDISDEEEAYKIDFTKFNR